MTKELKALAVLTQSHSCAKKLRGRRRAEGPWWEDQQWGLQGHLPFFIKCPLVAESYQDDSRLAGSGVGVGVGVLKNSCSTSKGQ